MKYRLLLLKRTIEDVFIFPFILLGRIIAVLRPLKREYRIYFFFPFYHTGGAEKIHSMISKAVGGKDCIIYFTRKSVNQRFLKDFRESGCTIKDISKYTDNKGIYFMNLVFRGIITSYINKQSNAPVVFNGQCNFGYKISPWVKKNIKQVELIHSFNTFSGIRLPFLPFISKTVMISKLRINEHLQQYKQLGVPSEYGNRIAYISNAAELENITTGQKDYTALKIIYSGRGTEEKRVHLVAAIAEKLQAIDPSIQFTIVGDISQAIDISRYPFIEFTGNLSDAEQLKSAYMNSNVLLLTSSTEGFPLVIIEGMAYGCAIISTPVGDIPEHVKDGVNGFLFTTIADEQQIINEGVEFILRLKGNRELLEQMSAANINYAQQAFSFERFAEDYKNIIQN